MLTWPHHHSSAMGENTTDAETITLPLATLDLEGIEGSLNEVAWGLGWLLAKLFALEYWLTKFHGSLDIISIVSL